jgi:hypothetical protein
MKLVRFRVVRFVACLGCMVQMSSSAQGDIYAELRDVKETLERYDAGLVTEAEADRKFFDLEKYIDRPDYFIAVLEIFGDGGKSEAEQVRVYMLLLMQNTVVPFPRLLEYYAIASDHEELWIADLAADSIGSEAMRIGAVPAQDPALIDFFSGLDPKRRSRYLRACLVPNESTTTDYFELLSSWKLIFDDSERRTQERFRQLKGKLRDYGKRFDLASKLRDESAREIMFSSLAAEIDADTSSFLDDRYRELFKLCMEINQTTRPNGTASKVSRDSPTWEDYSVLVESIAKTPILTRGR